MKIIRWFLLGLALAFLIVPMGSISVYAQEREIAFDSADVQPFDGPQASSNDAVEIVRTKHVLPFTHEQLVRDGITFAIPALVVLIGKIVLWISAALGGTVAGIAITEYIKAKFDKGEYEFLQQWTDEDAKRFANSLERYVKQLEARCSSHDYSYIEVHRRPDGLGTVVLYISVTMEFNFDKSTGAIECKDPTNGTVHFTKNIDTWIKTNYGN